MTPTFQKNVARLGQQLLAVWKQLGLNQRITIAFAGVAVLAGLGSLAYWSSNPSYALLFGGLDESDAARIIQSLEESKTPHKVANNGHAILVPQDQVYKLRMQLVSKGALQGQSVGLELFDKPNFGISDFAQRINFIRAIQGELARTISQLDDVQSARVMITMPENRLLADASVKSTASVFLLLKGRSSLAPATIEAIRFLVANAVEGLSPNNVVVADNKGKALATNQDDQSLTGQSTSQLAARRDLEQYLARKAETMLERVLGPGQAVVQVAAVLNWDTHNETEEKYDPEGYVLRTSTLEDETLDSTTGEPTSQPVGTATNSNTTTNSAAGTNNSSKTRKKRTNSQFEINKTVRSLAQAAGGIQRLSAAVFIASRYQGSGPTRQPIERPAPEIENLRRVVMSAIGIEDNADSTNGNHVTLVEMPFNEELALELNQQLDRDARLRLYWDIGRQTLFGLLGLGVLAAFWKLLNRPAEPDLLVASASPAHPRAPSDLDHAGHDGPPLPTPFPPRRREPGQGVVTVDMLNQLIRENPEGVTQAVRSWLTRGSNANN